MCRSLKRYLGRAIAVPGSQEGRAHIRSELSGSGNVDAGAFAPEQCARHRFSGEQMLGRRETYGQAPDASATRDRGLDSFSEGRAPTSSCGVHMRSQGAPVVDDWHALCDLQAVAGKVLVSVLRSGMWHFSAMFTPWGWPPRRASVVVAVMVIRFP